MAKASSPKGNNNGEKISFVTKKKKSKTTKPRNHGSCARGRQKFFPTKGK